MKLEGYHNTEEKNVEHILRDGFVSKTSDEHWLGQGIYFFADIDLAIDNIDMLKHESEVKTIAVEIQVDESEFLDLDKKENLNVLENIVKKTLKYSKKPVRNCRYRD